MDGFPPSPPLHCFWKPRRTTVGSIPCVAGRSQPVPGDDRQNERRGQRVGFCSQDSGPLPGGTLLAPVKASVPCEDM
ncbi:hypothetical protein CGCSCA4_v014916 [Colletotrichum siamense]|uniref:Uncharacterized protein n=1 Tax=Colletotrichum siamense TaxID=690259 RepID=A0A9P5BNX6_COLSI|nr:hypothetical protein CGCSCA4_v014916 [Colletotrichum siamense]KAF4846151.1 hypothetical protein CGCSCA2_v013266 [Colletotrichum siamense]